MAGRPCTQCDFIIEEGPAGWVCPGCSTRLGEKAAPAPARLAGRPRNFLGCLAAGILTLGIYFYYYEYKVFAEVDRQEGAVHWSGVFALRVVATASGGLLSFLAARNAWSPSALLAGQVVVAAGLVLQATYLYRETGLLRKAATSAGVRDTVQGGFVATVLLSGIAMMVNQHPAVLIAATLPQVMAYLFLQDGINRYWNAQRETSASQEPAPVAPATPT